MKILFTKKFEHSTIFEKMGYGSQFDCTEVITIEIRKKQPFPLKDHSLIFSSIHGVKSFFASRFKPNNNYPEKKINKIYTVGPRVKHELQMRGFPPFRTFPAAAELKDFIIKNAPKENFLHFCGNLSPSLFDKKQPLQSIGYKKIEMYTTKLLFPFIHEQYDALVFFSPSGVRSYVKHNSLEGKKIFSIGKTTENELKKFTRNLIFTSKKSNLEDLLYLIRDTTS
ncbi:MAG: uroporphyrinogen-III synthase [Bergeyella sp.]|nr:uroporphyrinogen-III synthase [Bergeyella sp.]